MVRYLIWHDDFSLLQALLSSVFDNSTMLLNLKSMLLEYFGCFDDLNVLASDKLDLIQGFGNSRIWSCMCFLL